MRVELDLPKDALEQLQDECEEFRFAFGEFVSLILIAAVNSKLDGKGGCLYEQTDWKWMKEQGICE